MRWELSIGARPDRTGTRFRVWAPQAARAEVVVLGKGGSQRFPLIAEPDGYFSAHLAGFGTGTRYAFSLDGAEPRPDPASRAQPDGVHAFSMVVDPAAFTWFDSAWSGVTLEDLVISSSMSGRPPRRAPSRR